MADIFEQSLQALRCCDIAGKVARINTLTELVNNEDFNTQTDIAALPITEPGRPVLPIHVCLLYTSPSPRDKRQSRMPSSA